jgi:UDP-GlcNAc:undecaprenyl-phosphate/decaprenyl-phosphate GlcNAc-1-phosphate transferase
MSTAVLIHLVIAVVVALVLVPTAIRAGHRYGLLDLPGRHKRHKRPVSYLGGAALLATFWIAVLAPAAFGGKTLIEPAESLPWMMGGALLVFLVGFIDDLRPISAVPKLCVQAAAGVLLYLGGLKVDPISIPFMGQIVLSHWSVLITVLWVVGLTNAINLIDGLDGLAGGVTLIAALVMAGLGIVYQLPAVLTVAAALIGFLSVFLYYNRYPARIFLGDSGSLQLGYYFAVISLLVPFKSYTAAALYLPLLTLGVPILETSVSIVRRLISGKKIMTADRRHLFHFLALAGLSPRQVVLVFYSLSLVFGLSTVAMFLWDRVLVSVILGLFMVVIFVGFLILTSNLPRVRKDNPKAGR